MSSKKEFLNLKPRIWQQLYHLFKERDPQESRQNTIISISNLLVDSFDFVQDLADKVAPTVYDIMAQAMIYLYNETIQEAAATLQNRQESDQKGGDCSIAFVNWYDPKLPVVSFKSFDSVNDDDDKNIRESIYFEESNGDYLLFSAQDLLILSGFIKDVVLKNETLALQLDGYIKYTQTMNDTMAKEFNPEAYAQLKRNQCHYERGLKRNRDFQLLALLTSFVAYARYNAHPSNWIHYKKHIIFYLAYLDKLKESERISLTQQLHSDYGLNMQVVGSTNPIPCFQFTWMANQPTPGNRFTDNPFMDMGLFKRENIIRIVLFLYKVNIKDYIDPILARLK